MSEMAAMSRRGLLRLMAVLGVGVGSAIGEEGHGAAGARPGEASGAAGAGSAEGASGTGATKDETGLLPETVARHWRSAG